MNDNAAISSAYRTLLGIVGEVEPRISQAIRDELTDQRASLKLIASENYASLPVLAAMGTW
ncbi:MAG: glycine hydroxymethyltransferase, partial [Arachnia propionica]